MVSFKQYTFIVEKRKKRKKHKKRTNTTGLNKGIYGMPLFWYSYPQGGFAEIDGGTVSENVGPAAQKLINTIKGWKWEANKPSPQTKRLYPQTGKFHNNKTSVKVSEMLDNTGRVRPEWQQDFKTSVVQWLNDLVAMLHPGVNQLKDILGIEDDINQQNQSIYQQQVNQVVNQISPQVAARPQLIGSPQLRQAV